MADHQAASRRRRSVDRSTEQPSDQASTTDEAATESEADLDDIDALLDEIDEVLEENAEDFVRNYVQKGGQ